MTREKTTTTTVETPEQARERYNEALRRWREALDAPTPSAPRPLADPPRKEGRMVKWTLVMVLGLAGACGGDEPLDEAGGPGDPQPDVCDVDGTWSVVVVFDDGECVSARTTVGEITFTDLGDEVIAQYGGGGGAAVVDSFNRELCNMVVVQELYQAETATTYEIIGQEVDTFQIHGDDLHSVGTINLTFWTYGTYVGDCTQSVTVDGTRM